MPRYPDDGGELAREVRRLADQVSHWTPARWAAPRAGGPRNTAVHELIQRLAEQAADAEGVRRRPVPRLGNDSALPDQLRVIAADLGRFGSADAQTRAAREVALVRRGLS